MSYKNPGAYTVRYLFVICDFYSLETEKVEIAFSWVEPSRLTIWNLFDIGPQMQRDDCHI